MFVTGDLSKDEARVGSATCLKNLHPQTDFEEVYETLGGHMFHLEKVFSARNPQLALEGLQSIAKVEWLKFLFAKIHGPENGPIL